MFYGMKHWILWLSICHISYMSGEMLCSSELLIHSNITAELQSDVLLPCNFHPTLLGSDKTADIAVVWTQKNTTTHSLLEISLQGDVRFWDYKGGRIKTFPKLSESGNFSILVQKVQLYDLSLYRCELFNGFNCSIAYQEIHLIRQTGVNILEEKWLFIAVGGGAGVLALLAAVVCFVKRTRFNASNERIYANSRFERRNDKQHSEEKHSSNQHAPKAKMKVHASKPRNHSNIYANNQVEAVEIYANQTH
ncbi:uncharacterized protein LOC124378787 [Silurus meridionalis]|uniref:Ig-like domain-containing protein n=1 Tax=Silurus meridionalis TaxID=175797 RepID=A0A8T0A983_SILME|nr:uncharacterized protein LOC124378787 [Silurus meridionalis]KAF7688605.1 hypothetical protein HF521_013412 [Silurus meridionalis]